MVGKNIVLFILAAFFGWRSSDAAKILAIFPLDAKSHYIMYGTIMRELAARGHEVTVASLYPEPPELKNIKFVDMRNLMVTPLFTVEYLKDMSYFDNIPDIIGYSVDVCTHTLNISSIKGLLNNKYDLFITEFFGCDCFMGFGHKLNIPTVGLLSSVTLPWTSPVIGHFENPAYVPSYFLPFTQKMTLFQRVFNTMFSVYAFIAHDFTSNQKVQKFVEENLGEVPSLRSMSENVTLILSNSHFSINQIKPTTPQLIEVGGLHIPMEIPPIPQELEEFFSDAKEGVILFSLGSYAPAETIDEEKMKAILEILGSLPFKILWKINGSGIKNLPTNIKTSEWIPQLSVLCDPRTKMFIAHGGLLGLQETIYCGVPVLGIPLFADQYLNIHGIQEKGAGLALHYDEINKETFSTSVHKLLYEDSYRENARRLSNLFKDRPQHPLHTAVFWIEYVLRHKGAPHLKSPTLDLAWYQYLLLDVFAITLGAIVVILYILYRICKLIKDLIKHDDKNILAKKTS